MQKIHKLSSDIISKIAAGEVIERPAYAVKELVENAIDVGADSISIHIENSGLKKIVVTDNGEGMSKEDVALCFLPHTTSKISTAEDLHSIKSLGFRGEALSSIAAIGNMTIKSRISTETAGICVQLKTGNLIKISLVGMPFGTSISVENLFANVPARKKFLKSVRTEFRHILDIVMQYAIAFPDIRFLLIHDGNIIFDHPKNRTLSNRIQMLFGKDIFAQFLPVEYEYSFIKISGFLSRPQLTTNTTNKHYFFVNRRKINDKTISATIKDAYGTLLDATAYPIAILFFSLPYEIVDVNVHPKKEQVSFVNSDFIFDHLRKAISYVLEHANLTFQDESLFSPRGNTSSFAGMVLKEHVLPWNVKDDVLSDEFSQFHKLYLITQTKTGLLFIDQHAAHERILFEQFSRAFHEQRKRQQVFQLPKTISFDVSVSDAELLKEQIDTFSSLGFVIDNFRGTTFTLHSVPLLFKDRDVRFIIQELLDNITENRSIKDIDTQTRKMLAYLACRAAIKAGEKLTKEDAKKLAEKLEETDNNATCPHGRPTRIEIHLDQLHRMFKRK